MVVSVTSMIEGSSTSHYALGSTDAEHERLIWQAERVVPLTERLFREAGMVQVNVYSIWAPAWAT